MIAFSLQIYREPGVAVKSAAQLAFPELRISCGWIAERPGPCTFSPFLWGGWWLSTGRKDIPAKLADWS